MKSQPQLLECTLRDGSYAVDFQFSADFTEQLTSELARLGFPYIEVGHGIGIGASDKVSRAAATDDEYAKAAGDASAGSKWGMFAIPGIAQPGTVERYFAQGMDFVRIGIDAFAIDQGLQFIADLDFQGKEVFVNFMKSYALSPKELTSRVEAVTDLGINGVYLVDSAGGMLPAEVISYAETLETYKHKLVLGFHGHDNLGLAVSHSLALAERGFDMIDCTMQGLGRSSGNAGTEHMVSLFNRLEIDDSYSVIDVLQVADKLVRPKILMAGYSGLDTLAGHLLFHTSYMEDLITVARKFGVDPYLLMQEHCAKSITSGSIQEFETAAEKVQRAGGVMRSPLPLDRYSGHEQA